MHDKPQLWSFLPLPFASAISYLCTVCAVFLNDHLNDHLNVCLLFLTESCLGDDGGFFIFHMIRWKYISAQYLPQQPGHITGEIHCVKNKLSGHAFTHYPHSLLHPKDSKEFYTKNTSWLYPVGILISFAHKSFCFTPSVIFFSLWLIVYHTIFSIKEISDFSLKWNLRNLIKMKAFNENLSMTA